MVECINIENNHLYSGNPLCAQHKLRFKSIIERQSWNVPYIRNMEYDSYDNPAAHYLVIRNQQERAIGVSRLYPTDRPYMLQEHFSHLVTKKPLPKDTKVWETTRFCIDDTLPPPERKKIMHNLVVAHLEFALDMQIKTILAVTYPVFWKNIFINSGWNVEWLGNVHKSDEGYKIVAGSLNVSKATLNRVREITNIHEKVLHFLTSEFPNRKSATNF